jgi:hypothetical protein
MDCHRTASCDGNVYLGATSELCKHRIAKKFCLECGGSHVCVTCRLTTTRLKNTECSPCRRFRDGDAPLKQRESAFMAYLDKAIASGDIPQYTSHDKAVALGMDPMLYGANRPDVLWRLDTHWVIVEIDEGQHKGHSYSCERRRELELCNCAGGLPVHFIRFNPDTFKTGSKSARVKSVGETMPMRHAAVVSAIKNAVADKSITGLTFTKMYFDCKCIANGKNYACKFEHSTTYENHEEFLKNFQ